MTTILHLDSSITGDHSISRRLSTAIVARLRDIVPDPRIVTRDLVADPLPAFTAESLAGLNVVPEPQPPEHAEEERIERLVLSELLDADIVVVGAPMYNLTVPSQLKTWVDYVTVAGRTFKYTPQGAVGLLPEKRVYIASSRGGIYSEASGLASMDHQESYLEAVFGFFGITQISVVRAEGVRISPELAEQALAEGLAQAAALELGVGAAA